MPQEICASRQRPIACRGLFVAVVAAGLGCLPAAILDAQSPAVRGYITAVHPPDGFDVNGEHVVMTAQTQFGPVGAKIPIDTTNPVSNGPTRGTVEIGAWVEVIGEQDHNTKTVTAQTVLFRDDGNQKLTGLGVIEKVISTAPDLVFAADGYHIRVTPATEVKFPRDLNSAADVHAGLWVLYEGKLGQDGLLAASKVRFLSAKHAKEKSAKASGDSSAPATTTLPPANGGPTAKVTAPPPNIDYNRTVLQTPDGKQIIQPDENTYTVSADQALQSRVSRIGMNLVPAYLLQLPVDSPAKIEFLFYAIDDPAHEVHTFPKGLILVPAELAARFKNDDQLAAVLADGIAFSLQEQAPMVIQMNRTTLAEAGALAAVSLVGGGFVASSVYQHEIDKALKEQRGRVALELMADAGYDPWQAPEAWRLAEAKKLPGDSSTLKYADRSLYQLGILNLMYKKPAPTNATASGSTANTSARANTSASGKP